VKFPYTRLNYEGLRAMGATPQNFLCVLISSPASLHDPPAPSQAQRSGDRLRQVQG
jgi:hypothetical protein